MLHAHGLPAHSRAPRPQLGCPTYDAVATSLEAAACCLQVLSSPGLPPQLYREELVTALVSLVKYHMQYNLLVMHDIKFRRLYRPSSLAGGEEVRARAPGPRTHACMCCPGGEQQLAYAVPCTCLPPPSRAQASTEKGKGKKPKLERNAGSFR